MGDYEPQSLHDATKSIALAWANIMSELQSLPDLLAGQFQRTIDWIRNPQLQALTSTDVILSAIVAFGLISIGLIAF